jgi:hypothetical protein
MMEGDDVYVSLGQESGRELSLSKLVPSYKLPLFYAGVSCINIAKDATIYFFLKFLTHHLGSKPTNQKTFN